MKLNSTKIPYKDSWFKVKLNHNSHDNDFYIRIILLSEKDNDSSHNGHLVIKYEESKKAWWIVEININKKYQSQNYGAAMILQGIKTIRYLTETYPESTKASYIHGLIGGIFIKDISMDEPITKSKGYWKIKAFYEYLGFGFIDDIHFEKDLSQTSLYEWEQRIELSIQVSELKLELAIKNQVLQSYEDDIKYVESKRLGRYLLNRR